MSINLISLQYYKTVKKINSTNDDAVLEPIIAAASNYIKTYIGRSLIDYSTTNKVEMLRPNKAKYYLEEFPIIAIASVEAKALDGTYTLLVEGTDYYVDYDSDAIESVSGNTFALEYSPLFRDPKGLRITYTGGYTDLPGELKLALVDLITFYLKGEYVQKKDMGGMDSINLQKILQIEYDLPQHIARVLQLYRTSISF